MKGAIYLSFLIMIMSFSTHTKAQLYSRADLAIYVVNDKFNETGDDDYIRKRPRSGISYNIGLGHIITDQYRYDLNFNYRYLYYKATEVDMGILDSIRQGVKMYSVLLNGYYDFFQNKVFNPYLTMGIGASINNSRDAIPSMNGIEVERPPGKKTTNFAWNIGIGTRLVLNKKVNFDIAYKYIDLGKITTKDPDDGLDTRGRSFRIKTHNIIGGLILYF